MGLEVAHLGEEEEEDRVAWELVCFLNVPIRIGHACEGDAAHEPVVGAVLDEVKGRHGLAAESVDKDSLVLSLEEVDGDEGQGDPLRRRSRAGEHGEDEGVDEEGSEVLDDVDRSPTHLRTEVLDGQ